MTRAGATATLAGRRVVVTGATGRVAFPIARALAVSNTVYGLARFSDPDAPHRLEAAGIVPVRADVADADLAALPDAEFVFHAGAALGPETRDWQRTFDVNAQAAGRLVARYRDAAGFVLCSTGSVYAYQGQRPLREDDPPGVHLGVYSLSKIAGEAVVEYAATRFEVPTTIIRIFSTYGPLGGAPADRLDRLVAGRPIRLYPERPNHYTPIYEDDYVRLGVRALLVGRVPPVVVNWAGSETVTAEDYCEYLGELVGARPRIEYTDTAPTPLWADETRMHEVLGPTEVRWQDGMRRMVAARHPDRLTAR